MVDRGKANPRQSIETVLGRSRPPVNNEISAERFQDFFEEKVAYVRVSK